MGLALIYPQGELGPEVLLVDVSMSEVLPSPGRDGGAFRHEVPLQSFRMMKIEGFLRAFRGQKRHFPMRASCFLGSKSAREVCLARGHPVSEAERIRFAACALSSSIA